MSVLIRQLACPVIFTCLTLLTSVSQSRAESVIAFWDFNDGFTVPNDTVQITHLATIGNGTLYQQRADTDGNGKSGVAYSNPMLGIDAPAGRGMAWNDISKTGDNDAEWFIELSTVGYTDIQVSFDIRGDGDNANEIVSYDVKFDTNPLEDVVNPGDVIGTIKDFQGGMSTEAYNNKPVSPNGDTYIRETVDLSSFAELNNQGTIAIRLDDFDGNGELSFDNVVVTGVVAVPEPSLLGLYAITACTLLTRRNRRNRNS